MLRRLATALSFALLLGSSAASAQGELIVVDDPEDVSDFAAPQTVAQLPGPDGRVTLREAIIAANNTPGAQTIHFNIPQSRWPALYTDRALVYSDFNPFVITGDSLTIDGRSQTAFTGDTNPDGNEVAFWGQHPNALGAPMFTVTSDHNVFVGLDAMQRRGYGISLSQTAEHNRIIGNTISAPLYAAVRIEGSNNTVGGTEVGEGNSLSSGNDGVRVESAFNAPPPTGNRIIGNYLTGSFAGVRVRSGAVGTVIGGPTAAERNVIADAGKYSSEGFPSGDQVMVEGDAVGTVIEGNYIGLTADGTASSGQRGPSGINVRDSDGTLIRGNAIGGIRVVGINHYAGDLFGWAIEIEGASDGTTIVGNRIGTTADGAGAVPSLNGIRVGPWFGSTAPTNTTIGGTAPSDANTVAHNERLGIRIEPNTTGVRVLGNAVEQNGLLGLDLGGDGPTANDLDDPDEGANRLQNHPGLASATLAGATLTVAFAVDTAPANATYPLRVEFFEADANGEEGARFLGADSYTAADHPAYRIATLDVTGSGLAAGAFVLATATDAAGNTSEFGVPVEVTGSQAAVAVDAAPIGGPIAIAPSGGTFEFAVTLTNTTSEPQTLQAWTAATGPAPREPVLAPRTVSLAAGQSLAQTLTQVVPAGAPAGDYTYTVKVGSYPDAVEASASFAVEKQADSRGARGARGGGAVGGAWSVTGWGDAVTATAGLPGGYALSEVYPNPFNPSTRFTLSVTETQAVTVAVYDALGRRVAVLHEGSLAAGAHAFTLDGAALPSGAYVVRVLGKSFAASRRLTLLR